MPEPEKAPREDANMADQINMETCENVNHFERLPKELVEMILSLLPYATLRRTAPFVCKSWAESVQSCGFWRVPPLPFPVRSWRILADLGQSDPFAYASLRESVGSMGKLNENKTQQKMKHISLLDNDLTIHSPYFHSLISGRTATENPGTSCKHVAATPTTLHLRVMMNQPFLTGSARAATG